tara:strand:+ start:280 stop:579 length:300 start_codon:yes stop_codon:yes gene_type:complete
MAFNTQNISDNIATKITGSDTNSVQSMKISNSKSSGVVIIDLYIQNVDDDTIYYILNNVSIPNGATLFLEREYLMYDEVSYSLYIQSNSGTGDLSIITI